MLEDINALEKEELFALGYEDHIQKIETKWENMKSKHDHNNQETNSEFPCIDFVFVIGQQGIGKLSIVKASFDKSIYLPVVFDLAHQEDRIRCQDEIRFLYHNQCIGKFTHGRNKKNSNAIVLDHLNHNKINTKIIKGLIKFVQATQSKKENITSTNKGQRSLIPFVFIYDFLEEKIHQNEEKLKLIKELIRLCHLKIKIDSPNKKDVQKWIKFLLKKIRFPNVHKYISKEDITNIRKLKNIHFMKRQIYKIVRHNHEKRKQKDIRSFMFKM